MKTFTIVSLIIIAILAIAVVVLYFLGRKAQRRQEEQKAQMDAMKQTISMLVIDKKKMKMKEAGLPQIVIDQTPRLLRGSKLPIIKAKVGPQIMTLVCDDKIFDRVPVKKEVKATVSGIYVTDVKGLRGQAIAAEPKKKSKLKEAIEKLQEKAGAKPLK